MWNNNDLRQTVIVPPRNGFLTPSPATGNSKPSFSPMSETKLGSPAAKRDLFHVIHKVPAGDSPYVRAKHVQLIEKDPGRAISLFWSAINAGDRVDSALKDMAIVMKQLDRSDEAIEAVKSFRHLCPVDSQESIDNVLVELYKRAGRTEEEIEMLERKLKRIEEGSAFSGRRTKTARSQGKKIHVTLHEEKSRILGNLAWAYLQQNNYQAAEEYYRKALLFEPDKNKQCNLAICLLNMNRLGEAKSVLRSVRNSFGTNLMDESFARSFERAWDMLVELDPSAAKTEGQHRNIPRREEEDKDKFFCGTNFENKSKSCDDISALEGMSRKYLEQPQPVTVDQLKSGFLGKRRAEPDKITSWRRNTEPQQISSWHRKQRSSPSPFTQPRRCLWKCGTEVSKKRSFSSDDDDWRKRDSYSNTAYLSQKTLTDEEKCPSSNTSFGSSSSVCNTNTNTNTNKKKKSWADMAEEEEEGGEFDFFYDSPFLQTQMKMEENNENADCNIDEDHHRFQTQMRDMSRNLERCGLSDSTPMSQPLSVRRSLFFEHDTGKSTTLLRRNRLKVFEDITRSP